MAFANRLDQKKLRRYNRLSQKQTAAKRITHCGLIVTALVVKTQRYLKRIGLPHSASVASVTLRGDTMFKGANHA